MPLSEGATRARHARRLLQRVLDFAPDGTTIHPIVRIGRHAAEGIVEASAEQEADLIIFGWGGKPPAGRDGSGPDGLLADDRRGRARLAVRHRRRQAARLGEIRRILVPVRGGPHAELALRYADAIARHHDAHGRRAPRRPAGDHPRGPRPGRARPRRLRQAAPRGPAEALVRRPPTSATRSCARPSAPTSSSWARPPSRSAPTATTYLFGALPEAIAARAKPTVIVVKTREPLERADVRTARRRGPRRSRPPTARRGSSGRSRPRRALVRRVELPPRRVRRPPPAGRAQGDAGPDDQPRAADARTRRRRSGRSSGARCARWWAACRSLDEVLVIDSPSTDRTREIAEAEGARVVQHPDVLPRYGSFRGKGEALWKSLYETSGDLIVWADTDVKNWHPRMVYGTLGPLLHEPRLQYVKGYYQRPIVEGGVLKEGGGGRVTELVARPLINLFYPELSGLIQPLVGRVRRTPDAARVDPVLHRLRGRDRAPHRRRRAARDRRPRPGRPRAAGPSQPGARGPLADVVRHPAGGHEAAGGAAQGPPLRRDGLDHEAAALGQGPPLARGHRARRPGAPADDPHPRVPRAARATGSAESGARPSPELEPVGGERAPWPRGPRAHRPLRAGLVQGLADLRPGRPGAGRSAGRRARPADDVLLARWPTAAKARSRRSRPPAAGTWSDRATCTTRSGGRSRRAGCARRRRTGPSSRWPRRPASRASPPDGARRDRRPRPSAPASCSGAAIAPGSADRPRHRRQRHDRWRPGLLRARAVVDATARIDLAGLDPRLADVDLEIACDVTNPLLGPTGAAATYGPQKGATAEHVVELDARLAGWADVLEAATGRHVRDMPGAGAAGGVGFALLAIATASRRFALRPGRRAGHGGDRASTAAGASATS